MNLFSYAVIALSTTFAAFVQTNMGFGGAVILINILPLFFPYSKALGIMQCAILAYNLFFTILYRKNICWKVMLPALIPGTIVAVVFTFISTKTTPAIMNLAVGIVFIILSVYNLFFTERLHIGNGCAVGITMGTLAGITNSFFGFAGPPIASYFASSIDDKISYFATSQFFYLCSSIACVSVRLLSGIVEKTDIPNLIFITFFFAVGSFLGLKVMKKINGLVLKNIIFTFIGLNGLYIIIREVFFTK